MTVNDLLAQKGRSAIAMDAKSTVEDAIRTMHDKQISAILVSENGKTVGIFTERDVVKCYLSRGGKPFNQIAVGDVMTKDLVIAETGDDMHDIMSIMIDKCIRHLPVTDGERIVGMLSIRDIVKAQVKELHAKIHYLKDYVSGIHGGLWI